MDKQIYEQKCKVCKELVTNEVGILKDGVYQIGQGSKKSLITFCSKRCLNKYETIQN